jgi:hypothetical protein
MASRAHPGAVEKDTCLMEGKAALLQTGIPGGYEVNSKETPRMVNES